MENWSKIALFSPKMSQKAPRDPLRPPMTMKIIFLRCQDMKTIWQKKEFLVYLPQKKSWSDQTMRSAAILVFRRYGSDIHGNLAVEFTFFNQYYVLDHLKQKNGCSGGGAGQRSIQYQSCLKYNNCIYFRINVHCGLYK